MSFMQVAEKARESFTEHFSQFDISPGKYSVLMELAALGDNESLKPSDLAARIGVSRATITGLVDGLLKQNYVTRREQESDRRSQSVALTKQGRAFMGKLLPVQFQRMAKLMAPLSETEAKQLDKICSKLDLGAEYLQVELKSGSRKRNR